VPASWPERIRAAVAGLEIPEVRDPVTASLGIAHLNPFDLNGGHLLLRADHALYAAKEAGRNPRRVRTASGPDARRQGMRTVTQVCRIARHAPDVTRTVGAAWHRGAEER
jgi:predicted signal transduction protein with EAL and GGDEF domain